MEFKESEIGALNTKVADCQTGLSELRSKMEADVDFDAGSAGESSPPATQITDSQISLSSTQDNNDAKATIS